MAENTVESRPAAILAAKGVGISAVLTAGVVGYSRRPKTKDVCPSATRSSGRRTRQPFQRAVEPYPGAVPTRTQPHWRQLFDLSDARP